MMVSSFLSCGVSISEIEDDTKELMVEKFKEDGQKLVVKSLSLINESGHKYSGIADCILDGEKIQLDVTVLCDGNNIQAEWEPTAEYLQKSAEKAQKQFEKEMDEVQKQLEKEIDNAQKEYEEINAEIESIEHELDDDYDE